MLGLSTPIILSVVACGHANTSLTEINQDNFKEKLEDLSKKDLFKFKIAKGLDKKTELTSTIRKELNRILKENKFDLNLDKYTIGWTDTPNQEQLNSDTIWHSGSSSNREVTIRLYEKGEEKDGKDDKKVAEAKIKYDIIIGSGGADNKVYMI